MQKDNFARVGILIAIVIATVFGVANQVGIGNLSAQAGAIGTRFPDGISVGTTVAATKSKFLLGTTGTPAAGINFGTCSLATSTNFTSFTVAATTTVAYDCPAPGVLATDTGVFVQSATSSITSSGGWEVESASASSTAGSIRVHIRNNTGASAVIPASIASSTRYFVIR